MISLVRALHKLRIEFTGRMQPKAKPIPAHPQVLIFCTLGMGEIMGMKKLIDRFPKATLVIRRKQYIIDYMELFFPKHPLLFTDEPKLTFKWLLGCFDLCIVPWECLRWREMEIIISLKIPNRIGQINLDHTHYSFILNDVTYVTKFEEQERTFNELLTHYERLYLTF
jgi:hypothetical protein